MSKTSLAVRDQQAVTFTPDEISTIKSTVAKDATDTELKLFLHQCSRTRLDPFSRQIYFFKIGGKASIQASIDGFRLIAGRSEKYAGQTTPLYLDDKGQWHEVWTQKGYPIAAKVGVYHKDFKEPLYAIAKWDSYVAKYNGQVGNMWAKMPEVMLAKVAEALALRKAFPNDLSGIYASEEMAQAETDAPANSYRVERVTPATDDEPGSRQQPEEPRPEEDGDMEAAYEAARDQIKTLLTDLKEDISTKAKFIAAVKKHAKLPPVPENYSKILQALRELSPIEKLTDPQ